MVLSTWRTIDYPGAINTEAHDISGTNIVGWYSDGNGGYGFIYTLLSGDLNYDGIVDFKDLAKMANKWLQSGAFEAELNGDGIVDFADFAILAENGLGYKE